MKAPKIMFIVFMCMMASMPFSIAGHELFHLLMHKDGAEKMCFNFNPLTQATGGYVTWYGDDIPYEEVYAYTISFMISFLITYLLSYKIILGDKK